MITLYCQQPVQMSFQYIDFVLAVNASEAVQTHVTSKVVTYRMWTSLHLQFGHHL